MEPPRRRPGRGRAIAVVAVSLAMLAGVVVTRFPPPARSGPGRLSGPAAAAPGRPPAYISRIQFWNATVGWAQVGRGGPYTALFRTTDAGLPWIESIRRTPADFAYVRFFDGSRGVATEAAGNISETADGGVTWTLQGELPRSADGGSCTPFFSTPLVGWCLQHPATARPFVEVLATTDGGATWAARGSPLAEPSADVSNARFSDPGSGAQAGWIPVLAPAGAPAIAYSSDAGSSWARHVFTSPQPAVTRGGILTGRGSGQSLVIVTQWQVSQADTTAILYAHRSDDGGRTWRDPVALPVIPLGVIPVVLRSLTQWMVLDDRNLWSTADAGQTWQSVPSSLAAEVRVGAFEGGIDGSLWVLDLGRGGSPPVLLRSVNGGYHWDPVPVPR